MNKLPKKWSDISIKQFIEVSTLAQSGLDDVDLKVKLMSIFTGEPEAYFLNLNYKQFNKLCNSVSFLNDLNISGKLIYNFKIDGVKFVVNPNISDLSTAEYIDLSGYMGSKEKIQENLHKLLAIFIKPKHKWFGLKKVYMRRGEVAELLYNKMPITIAYPMSVFFCELLNNSIKTTKDYLEKTMKKTMKKAKKAGLLKNGDGG
jgi:hypothetical protein